MIAEKVTNAVAAAGVASPWWLPKLADVSQAFTLLLPILGGLWLVIQILHKLLTWRRPPEE